MRTFVRVPPDIARQIPRSARRHAFRPKQPIVRVASPLKERPRTARVPTQVVGHGLERDVAGQATCNRGMDVPQPHLLATRHHSLDCSTYLAEPPPPITPTSSIALGATPFLALVLFRETLE